jgi:hypothetical protein
MLFVDKKEELLLKMKSCKKQTNKSRWRILDDVDIIAQCM